MCPGGTAEGTWLLVCTCACWGAARGAAGPAAGALTCFTNNILRFDCRWSGPELGQGAGSWLVFTSNHAQGGAHRCVFLADACSFLLPPEEVLLPSDSFTITLHRLVSGEEQVSLLDPQFLPRRHVKLDPPSDLQSNVSADSCVLTWGVSPALEPLRALLDHELAFRRQEEAWERARHKGHIVGVTRLRLEAAELDAGSTYEARLRVQMAAQAAAVDEERFEGQWSEWSQPVRFAAPGRPGPRTPPRGPDRSLVALCACLLLAGLAYLLLKLSPRVKGTLCQAVPSPAAFFQPLYSVHSGNFQTWTGVHRAGVLPSHGGSSPLPGASKPGCGEAISPLACVPRSPARPQWPAGLKEGAGAGCGLLGGTPAPVSGDQLPAGSEEWGEQLPAYLPQEDWTLMPPTRPAPPDPTGGGSDYCALACDGVHPLCTLACGPPADTQHGSGPCLGTGDSQRRAAGPGALGP
ncbi:interleukin-9 receptor [Dasypus novemcinctus]|uniref:interleukin-9 receptor n=1 Tax=Dasypus novemcinctus TaxID=9361 RepID=UPI00265E9573|nr:interleukin-9 receptor [Dasypus novemcinctus]